MKIRLILFLLVPVISSTLCLFFYFEQKIYLSILFLLLFIFSFIYVANWLFRLFDDITEFFESVRSNDFTRRYPEKNTYKKEIYKNFNNINSEVDDLIKSAEIQVQYSKKIMELANTGILVYDIQTREVKWINQEFVNIFNIPYLKNIDWLKKRNEALYNKLIEIPLRENQLLTIYSGKQAIKVNSSASGFRANGRTYKLLAFHNINETLEEIESIAWKGLLNVMTHEIMNSIAPVSSLAESLKNQLQSLSENFNPNARDELEDIEIALETIHRRSEGLLHFSQNYRNLSQKISIDTKSVNLHKLATSVFQLMNPPLKQKGILLNLETNDLSVYAQIDRNLIEQTIINLITNAVYALKDTINPAIHIFTGITNERKPYITVADNGCGIPEEIRNKIFIPFFSTKKQGSGIGLTLSREIVKLHKGRIVIESETGKGSAFTILLREEEKEL